jgi:hypothetical protein
MPDITLVRQQDIQLTEDEKATARKVIFGMIDGLGEQNQSRWRRWWAGMFKLEPGEMSTVITHKMRSGPFHRRHMAIEQQVFDAQERFEDFEQFRYWLKVGSGWVVWAAGPAGGVVPIPKSISYAAADEVEFREFHEKAISFLRGPHAALYLWPHLKDAAGEMMDSILREFNE